MNDLTHICHIKLSWYKTAVSHEYHFVLILLQQWPQLVKTSVLSLNVKLEIVFFFVDLQLQTFDFNMIFVLLGVGMAF
jgi:hypothetical protein